VSDEYSNEEQWEEQDETLDILDDEAEASEEFEEISSEEVDQIVEALENLMASASSENIKTYLEEALTNIFCLIYDENDVGEDVEDEGDGDVLCDAA